MRRALACCVLVLSGCGEREEGLTVEVRATVTPVARAGLSFSSATLAVEEVELVACDTTRWWHALSPISVARAHGDTPATRSPRVSTQPVLVDLTTDASQLLALLRPPPGDSCALRLKLAPSTVDAPPEGTTLLLEGTRDGAPLRQLSTRRLTVELPLSGFAVDAARPTAHLALTLLAAEPAATADETLATVAASIRAP